LRCTCEDSRIVHTFAGRVSNVISEIIRENEIDLLVAGTHGRTGLRKLLLDSVAEELFRTATCPVLTVGPNVPQLTSAEHRGRDQLAPIGVEFRQILYATDFTPHSVGAASYAFSLAREFHARLILLHVIEKYGEPIDVALRKLEFLQSEDAVLRYPPEPVVEFGSSADRILQAAAEWRADLIVLGTRPGHVDAATHLPWKTAHKVVARANCPVLTVRE
jgi:nucleotide-binding universal stress UspA family protein